ncbi:hypothetical protein AVEN_162459-1 [Araneus ventricosus]|uniref:Uncharacterized protein n=1 Tax=Araneus ventricosus TaxID=182803 RepID=A0A4Y2K1B6_ARAVE|nr:hypothetical protein AVEN_162459-1 [Araneus ventricosus]
MRRTLVIFDSLDLRTLSRIEDCTWESASPPTSLWTEGVPLLYITRRLTAEVGLLSQTQHPSHVGCPGPRWSSGKVPALGPEQDSTEDPPCMGPVAR